MAKTGGFLLYMLGPAWSVNPLASRGLVEPKEGKVVRRGGVGEGGRCRSLVQLYLLQLSNNLTTWHSSCIVASF